MPHLRSAVFAAAFSLAGCAQLASLSGHVVTNRPINPPNSAQATILAGRYAADLGYNTLANLYEDNRAILSAAQKSQAKSGLLTLMSCPAGSGVTISQCSGYLPAIVAASEAGDQTTLTAQIGAAQRAVCNVREIIKPDGHACPS